MTKQARQRLGASAAAVGVAVVAVAAAVLPFAGTAAAATYDRHASMQTEVIVKAQSGRLVLARHDVIWVGGRVLSGHPVTNGFYAQIPVTAVASLRHAPGVASVTVVGSAINE
ncbi:MAG TPA: hypothetical protein VK662_00735 [Acidothermaceae bacterium]|nr:hypothetical protein [Acidothermaceae bacterium]